MQSSGWESYSPEAHRALEKSKELNSRVMILEQRVKNLEEVIDALIGTVREG